MIGMWFVVGLICLLIVFIGVLVFYTANENDSLIGKIIAVVVTIALIAGVIIGGFWYLNDTASGGADSERMAV